MPELKKIEASAAFTPEAGQIVEYLAEEDGKIVLKIKKSDGTVHTLSGGGADVTLGQIDANGNFQPLSFVGQAASNNGNPETVGNYYGWNGVLPSPSGGIKVIQGGDAVYYKCASVDTANKTWTGYLAVPGEDGTYSFEETVTTGLTYTSVTPVVGKTYSADALVSVSTLYTGIPTDGLVLHASLSSVAQTTETGQTITTHGTVTPQSVNSINGLYFDGNSYLEIESPALSESVRSVSLWCKSDGTSSWSVFVSSGQAGGYTGFDISQNTSNNIAFGGGGYDFQTEVSATSLHHVVAVFNGTYLTMYIDNTPYTQSMSSLHLNTPSSVRVGAAEEGCYLTGFVSALRIYNRVLTAEEVDVLYNEFTPTA